MKEIKIIVKKVGEPHRVEIVNDEYSTYNNLVGGYIEVVSLHKGILMVCNEEGKLDGLELNLILPNDLIVGDIFFCSQKGPDFASLTDAQISYVEKFLENTSVL